MTDNYMSQPYEDEARHEALVEQFTESDEYVEAIKEWAVDDDDTNLRFQSTPEFGEALDEWLTAKGGERE